MSRSFKKHSGGYICSGDSGAEKRNGNRRYRRAVKAIVKQIDADDVDTHDVIPHVDEVYNQYDVCDGKSYYSVTTPSDLRK